MTNTTGGLTVKVGDHTYRLWLGFSGLAEMQAKHGNDFIAKMQPPPDLNVDECEDEEQEWLPPLAILHDLILEALQRHHADEADRWLVDEILAAGPSVVERLFAVAFPDQVQQPAPGKQKGASRTP